MVDLIRYSLTLVFLTALSIVPAHAQHPPIATYDFPYGTSIDIPHAERDMNLPYFFKLSIPGAGQLDSASGFTADKGTEFAVWLDNKDSHLIKNSRSLGIKITSETALNVKDKIVFSPIMHNSPRAIDIRARDRTRFVSFDFMLDQRYEVPTNWLIHFQAFQCCNSRPPFSIQVMSGGDKAGDVIFIFYIIDDELNRLGSTHMRELFRQTVTRGFWNNMVLKLRPSPDEDSAGDVEMWLNGEMKFAAEAHWGYEPDKVLHEPFIGFDIGIYRRRQKTTQIIYFDNIVVSEFPPEHIHPNDLYRTR